MPEYMKRFILIIGLMALLLASCSSRKQVVRSAQTREQITEVVTSSHLSNVRDSVAWSLDLLLDSLEITVERPVTLPELKDSVLIERVTLRSRKTAITSCRQQQHINVESACVNDSTVTVADSLENVKQEAATVSVADPPDSTRILIVAAVLAAVIGTVILCLRRMKL